MDQELKALKEQQKQISKQYKSAQKMYDAQAKELQQLQPQYEQSIIQGYESQRPMLEQTAQKSLADIGMQKETTGQQRESALSQARRQYEQGLQRSQQLFGGVAPSNVGMATADILGAEQLRQMGTAQTQSAQNLLALGQAERDVQANLTNALQQLEVKKQQDLLKLRDSFRQELNQINAQKGTLAMNKANAQLQALQDYNARRRQLDDMVTTQRMNLESYAQQLALSNRYSPQNIASNIAIPDFKGLNDAQRSTQIRNLLTSQAGQLALTNSGFEVLTPKSGERVLFNPYTGLTIGLSGRRYADFSPNYAGETALEQVAGQQR